MANITFLASAVRGATVFTPDNPREIPRLIAEEGVSGSHDITGAHELNLIVTMSEPPPLGCAYRVALETSTGLFDPTVGGLVWVQAIASLFGTFGSLGAAGQSPQNRVFIVPDGHTVARVTYRFGAPASGARFGLSARQGEYCTCSVTGVTT